MCRFLEIEPDSLAEFERSQAAQRDPSNQQPQTQQPQTQQPQTQPQPQPQTQPKTQPQPQPQPQPQRGFPYGPFGPHPPFVCHLSGNLFHARDAFMPPWTLGFCYDSLPTVLPPQMRAPPYVACFSSIDLV